MVVGRWVGPHAGIAPRTEMRHIARMNPDQREAQIRERELQQITKQMRECREAQLRELKDRLNRHILKRNGRQS